MHSIVKTATQRCVTELFNCTLLQRHSNKLFVVFCYSTETYIYVSGIKDYSHWPTIPQVFIDGEFVGGCDVMLEMHKNGDLIDELQKAGIRSSLLDKTEGEKKDG